MTQALGSNAKLLIDFEDTFGEIPTSPNGLSMYFNSVDLKASQTLTSPETIRGNRSAVEPIKGNIDLSGNIEVPVDVDAFGYWLKAMFGNPTTSGSDPYTHKFVIGSSQPSLCIERGFSDIDEYALAKGCKVGSFEISIGGDGELTSSLSFLGAGEVLSDSSFDATPTSVSFSRVNNFEGAIKENDVSIANITEGSINIDFGLDGDNYCIGGGGSRSGINEGIAKVSGSIKAMFENSTLLDKAIAGTESSLEIKFTSGTKSLTFKVNELVFERTSPTISGPGGVKVDLNWQGYYNNNSDQSAITVTLVNSQATY